jgi:hypothetical protein
MATMNKPASDERNWGQAVNDNWAAIETGIIDNGVLAAKGDLIVANGASNPSRLAAGSNGQYLRADTAQAPGVRWNDPSIVTSQDVVDLLWGKKFFSDEGFLPSTKMFEYIGTPPAFSGTAGSATWTRESGGVRPSGIGIGWYDLGVAKSKILIVIGSMIKFTGNIAVVLTSSAPTGIDPDGYSMFNDTSGPGIWKRVSGVWTRIDSASGFSVADILSGYALYYDDATNAFKLFIRQGSQWLMTGSGTDSTYSTMRYISFQSSGANQRWVTPFVCYAS